MNLELWLTTLITISPQQDDINIQQLKPAQLLDLLSSGNVWVRRGHGMHVELLLTLREEPPPPQQLQDLAESILQAPVWEQLMLQPSLPSNVVLEPGIIHLRINHVADGGPQEEQRRHRIFSDVPAADVRPPEGVPTIALHSVRCRMDIVEIRQRPRTTNKKPKTSVRKSELIRPETSSQEQSQRGLSDLVPQEQSAVANEARTTHVPVLVGLAIERKRKRPVTYTKKRTASSPAPSSNVSGGMGRSPATISDLQSNALKTLTASNEEYFESLVDGALRLSVCGSFNNRSRLGLKVKASTFALGLADVAPALWRPGYLPALSQRAHMLPTISRSVSQVACVRATSLSLKDKLTRLTTVAHEYSADTLAHRNLVAEQDAGRLTSSVTNRLWLHLQKNITSKSAMALQSFVTSRSKTTACSDSDDMLEELREHQKRGHTPIPSPEDDEETDLFNCKALLPKAFWSSAKHGDNLLSDRTIEVSKIEHDVGENGDDSMPDPVPLWIDPVVASLGTIDSGLTQSDLSDTVARHDLFSDELTIRELQYNPGSNRAADDCVTTSNLHTLPILAKDETWQDDLLFDKSGESVKEPILSS